MKYIRTGLLGQEKIYNVEKAKKYQDMFVLRNNDLIQPISCCNLNEIGRVADTIEELCDEFVMNTHLTHYTNSHLKDLLLEYDKFHIKEGIVIYGAIWTDKGLIYVAKMNEKGKMELL